MLNADGAHGRATDIDVSGAVALDAWRTIPPDGFDRDRVADLAAALAGVGMLREPRWRMALDGDGAVAAALGVDAMRAGGRLRTDLVFSLLVVRAWEGDPTAGLVIAHALARMGERRRGAGDASALAAAWVLWSRRARRRGARRGHR